MPAVLAARSEILSLMTAPNEVTAPDAASPVCLRSMVRGRGTGEFCR